MAYQSINPYTEELIKSFNEHTDEQLKAIIATAENTYKNDWRLRSLPDRKAIIKKAASIMRERLDEFATLITVEMGKLFEESRGEVNLTADILDYYADNAETFLAPQKLNAKETDAVVESEPLGVLFCIEPGISLITNWCGVAAPNLMTGNTLIVKHARNVPQCALAFEKLSSMRALRWELTPMYSSPTSRQL